MLPELQVDSPATRGAAGKIAAALLAPGSQVNLTGDERQILALKAVPRHVPTIDWLRGLSITQASVGWTTWRIRTPLWPGHELPSGRLLRLLVALRVDFGSVIAEQQANLGKSEYYNDADWAKIQGARKSALDSAPEHARLIADAVAGVAEDPDFGADGPRIAALLLGLRDFDSSECAAFEQAAAQYALSPGADPWLSQLFLGRAAICRAWADRGSGFVWETTEDQFASFQKGLDRAFEHLIEAHRLHPDRPDAAAMLVTVAMGGGSPAHLTPEYWFERASASDPSGHAAYHALALATLPRWGGDAAAATAFFRRVADASDAGNRLANAMVEWLPLFHDDDQELLAAPAFAAAIVDALRPAFTPTPAGADPSAARSVALAVAFLAKDVGAMQDAIGDGNWEYRSPDPKIFTSSWLEMVQFVDAKNTVYGPSLDKARSAMRRGDVEAAATFAERSLRQPGLPDRVRAELSTFVAARNAPSEYERGGEIVLVGPGAPCLLLGRNDPPPPDIAPDAVSFGYAANNTPWTDRPSYVTSMRLGRRFTLSGRIRTTLRGESRTASSFGRLSLIACTRQDSPGRGIGVAVHVTRPSGGASDLTDPLVIEQKFRFIVDGAESNFEVDGKPVKILPFQIAPEKEWGDWLMVHGAADHPACTLELVELRARRLADQAPGSLPALK